MKKEQTAPKLGNLEKIQVALHGINYLATQIDKVKNIQLSGGYKIGGYYPGEDPETKEKKLGLAVQQLTEIFQSLGNFCFDQEMITPIDLKIIDPAFQILLKGNDRVDGKDPSSLINEVRKYKWEGKDPASPDGGQTTREEGFPWS